MPGPAAEGRVVDRPVRIGGARPQVVDATSSARAAGLAEQALVGEVLDHVGEDREDVDAHAGRLVSGGASDVVEVRPSGGSMACGRACGRRRRRRARGRPSRARAGRRPGWPRQTRTVPPMSPSTVTTSAPTRSWTHISAGSSMASARRTEPRSRRRPRGCHAGEVDDPAVLVRAGRPTTSSPRRYAGAPAPARGARGGRSSGGPRPRRSPWARPTCPTSSRAGVGAGHRLLIPRTRPRRRCRRGRRRPGPRCGWPGRPGPACR